MVRDKKRMAQTTVTYKLRISSTYMTTHHNPAKTKPSRVATYGTTHVKGGRTSNASNGSPGSPSFTHHSVKQLWASISHSGSPLNRCTMASGNIILRHAQPMLLRLKILLNRRIYFAWYRNDRAHSTPSFDFCELATLYNLNSSINTIFCKKITSMAAACKKDPVSAADGSCTKRSSEMESLS